MEENKIVTSQKEQYVAPEVVVNTFNVEQGFAISSSLQTYINGGNI